MFIEQNKLKRQSQLLQQNSTPDEQLSKALDENAKLTQTLEEDRLQHQQKVRSLLPPWTFTILVSVQYISSWYVGLGWTHLSQVKCYLQSWVFDIGEKKFSKDT